MTGHKKLNVILDIDETFVQYGGEEDTKKYEAGGSEAGKFEVQDGFIFRPHMKEFLAFLRDNCATVNLWTWSDMTYAKGLKNILQQIVPGLKISNVWVDEDVEASIAREDETGKNKDLNYLWYDLAIEGFLPCNTILIDDLKENSMNTSNFENSINLKAFEPMGPKKKKTAITKGSIRTGAHEDFTNDRILLDIIDIIKGVINKSDFCEDGDMPVPFPGGGPSPGRGGGKRRKTKRRGRKVKSTRKRR